MFFLHLTTGTQSLKRDNKYLSIAYFLATRESMMEYKKTPPIPIPHPRSLMGSRDSPNTRATPTMTMTRFAVLATDWVTAPVFLMVMVASSLYPYQYNPEAMRLKETTGLVL